MLSEDTNTRSRCKKISSEVSDTILGLDKFSMPITMNVNGISEVPSWPSAIVSLICYGFLFAYGVQKFQ
jgi:hypothetical protein